MDSQNYYVILGIHGTDPTNTANVARVRFFVNGEAASDQDFQLPALVGADNSIAPSNYQGLYEQQLQDQLIAALTTLQQTGATNGAGQ